MEAEYVNASNNDVCSASPGDDDLMTRIRRPRRLESKRVFQLPASASQSTG
jgi:hypothetical protein